MESVDFNDPLVAGVHACIMEGLNCPLSAITGVSYSMEKFLAVYVLRQFYGFGQRALSRAYSVNYLYVPTLVEEFSAVYARSGRMREIIQQILNKYERYETTATAS